MVNLRGLRTTVKDILQYLFNRDKEREWIAIRWDKISFIPSNR